MKKLSQSIMKKIIGAVNQRSACGTCYTGFNVLTDCILQADLLTGTVACMCPGTNLRCGDIEDSL